MFSACDKIFYAYPLNPFLDFPTSVVANEEDALPGGASIPLLLPPLVLSPDSEK